MRVSGTSYRSGTSFARGTMIDAYLSGDVCTRLYSVWEEHPEWPEVLRFSGGISAITCEMILDVREEDFLKSFGTKKADMRLAETILSVAKTNAGR